MVLSVFIVEATAGNFTFFEKVQDQPEEFATSQLSGNDDKISALLWHFLRKLSIPNIESVSSSPSSFPLTTSTKKSSTQSIDAHKECLKRPCGCSNHSGACRQGILGFGFSLIACHTLMQGRFCNIRKKICTVINHSVLANVACNLAIAPALRKAYSTSLSLNRENRTIFTYLCIGRCT